MEFNLGSGCSTEFGILEKFFQKVDCVFYHCDVIILSCSLVFVMLIA